MEAALHDRLGVRAVAGEAVHHATRAPQSFVVDNREGIVERVSVVNDQRKVEFPGEPDLRPERAPLIFARGEIAVVVEAGLTDSDDLRALGETLELSEHVVVERRGVVRVEADRRIDEVVAFRELDRLAARLEIEADVHHESDARGPRPPDDVFPVIVV